MARGFPFLLKIPKGTTGASLMKIPIILFEVALTGNYSSGAVFYREKANAMANILGYARKLVCSVRAPLNKHAKLGDCVIAKF